MVKGYTFYANRPNSPYRVAVTINGKRTYIGSYMTADEAKAVYEKVRAEHPPLPCGRKKGFTYTYKPKKTKVKPGRKTPRKDGENVGRMVHISHKDLDNLAVMEQALKHHPKMFDEEEKKAIEELSQKLRGLANVSK